MLFIEGFIITGVLLYSVGHALWEPHPTRFLIKFISCAAAAWIAEESSIRFYGFYTYSPAWHIFIVDVPLVVVMVWPAIIHSATVLSERLLPPNSRFIPLLAGCIVLTDAMLIEPVSVNFDLWRWYRPGLFGVPLIGMVGWGYFAFWASGFFIPMDRLRRTTRNLPIVAVVAVIGTHLFLLLSYWALLRWTMGPISPAISASAVWIVSVILLVLFAVSRTGSRVELKTLVVRIPAAAFFYVLLFCQKNSPLTLILYALAFMPPYLAMVAKIAFSNKPSIPNQNTMATHKSV